jgi:hypothetical protein
LDPTPWRWIREDRLFVADRTNNRIQIFDQDGTFITEWKQFGRPSGLAIDKDDMLYVADSESNDKEGAYGYNPGCHRGIRIGRLVGRLHEFYLSATEVLAASKYRGIVPQQYRDVFIFKLGSILAARLKARNIVDDHWRFRRLAERPFPLSLEDAYAKLQDELVSLQVLIRNFKAES